MRRDLTLSAGLAAAFAPITTAAQATVPEPPFNAVVVEDVTRPFSFDAARRA